MDAPGAELPARDGRSNTGARRRLPDGAAVTDELLSRGSETRALRRAAVRLGLQTGVAVAIVVVALVGVALIVVLRSQHSAAVDLIQQTVRRADDVTDPPAAAWLVIRTPTKLLSTKGLPKGFPDLAALDAAANGSESTRSEAQGWPTVVQRQRGSWRWLSTV